MAHDELTEQAISAAIEVHRYLGPGLLEASYRRCLAIELRDRGALVQEELVVPLVFKGHRLPLLKNGIKRFSR